MNRGQDAGAGQHHTKPGRFLGGGGEGGLFHQTGRGVDVPDRAREVARLRQDEGRLLVGPDHGGDEVLLDREDTLLLDRLEGFRHVALVDVGGRGPEERARLAIDVRRLIELTLVGLAALGVVSLEDVVVADPGQRAAELGILFQRLLILRDGVVVAAHPHEELGVRVIGVGRAGAQGDVLLERRFRRRVIAEPGLGVADPVVGGGEPGVQTGRPFVMSESGTEVRGRVAEKVPRELRDPLVVRIELQKLVAMLLGLGQVPVELGLLGQDPVLLTRRHLVRQADRLVQVLAEKVEAGSGERTVGVGHGEARVLLDGLIQQGRRRRGLEVVHLLAGLQEEGQGRLRRGGDRELARPRLGEKRGRGQEQGQQACDRDVVTQ